MDSDAQRALRGKVLVYLDGQDVTARAMDFDVEGQTVTLRGDVEVILKHRLGASLTKDDPLLSSGFCVTIPGETTTKEA